MLVTFLSQSWEAWLTIILHGIAVNFTFQRWLPLWLRLWKKASKKHPIPQLCKRTTLLYYLRISTTIHPKSQTIINISNIKYTIANAIYTLEMQKSRKVSLRLGCMNPKEPKPSFWSNMIYMPQCQVIMISTSSPKSMHYWFNADTPSVSFDISCDF